MKYVFGAILLISATFAGKLFSLKYKDRLTFYGAFSEFNKKFKTAVGFSFRTLNDTLRSGEQNPFTSLFIRYKDEKEEELKRPSFLTAEEFSFVCEYFENAGLSDKPTQLNYLNGAEEIINEKLKKCETEYLKLKPACVKLGFLFGLILFILVL